MSKAAHELPPQTDSEYTGLTLVHSVDTPEEQLEFEAYSEHVVGVFRGLTEQTDASEDIQGITSLVVAGGLVDDYVLYLNYPRLYARADELVSLRETSQSYLIELEDIFDKLGGNGDESQQKPVAALLNRLMSAARTSNAYKRIVFQGAYRRTLQIANGLFDLVEPDI